MEPQDDGLVVQFGPNHFDVLAFGPAGGWAFVNLPSDPPPDVWVRFAEGPPPGHRLQIVELHIDTSTFGSVSGPFLRSFPIQRLESAANRPKYYDAVRLLVWRQEVPVLNLAELAPVKTSIVPASAPRSLRKQLRALPDGQKKRSDNFYREVAELHAELTARGSRRPAVDIASVNGVPPTTVHRWMKEARRRGLVAPAGTRRS